MWSREYWKSTIERMIRGGAAAALSTFFVGDKVLNTLTVNWSEAGGIFLGGAIVSLLLSLGGNVTTGNGPSFNNEETVS